jgi:hypothetical protein
MARRDGLALPVALGCWSPQSSVTEWWGAIEGCVDLKAANQVCCHQSAIGGWGAGGFTAQMAPQCYVVVKMTGGSAQECLPSRQGVCNVPSCALVYRQCDGEVAWQQAHHTANTLNSPAGHERVSLTLRHTGNARPAAALSMAP